MQTSFLKFDSALHVSLRYFLHYFKVCILTRYFLW